MSMTIQQAIRALHLPGDHLKNYDEYGIYIDDELKEAMQMAITALREKAEREDPQPLTLEELQKIEKEPVWLHNQKPRPWQEMVMLVEVGEVRLTRYCTFWSFGDECELDFNPNEYGKTWTAYRHKPKEG